MCLVVVMGLNMGIGSVFADDQNENIDMVEDPPITNDEMFDYTGEASQLAEYNPETGEEKESVNLISRFNSSGTTTEAYMPEGQFIEKSPYTVLGKDNRIRITNTKSYPNTAIGMIRVTFPNGVKSKGTAWMYGNKVAMTAGHCIYSKKDGGWAKQVAFYPAKNGNSEPLGVYYSTKMYTDTKFLKNEDTNYDWGMLRFSSNVGQYTGYFGATYNSSASSQVGTRVTMRGYPGDKTYGTLWSMSGPITGIVSNGVKFKYTIDSYPGQSGSPVYNAKNQSLAIHTNSGSKNNYGLRIDKSLFDIMNNARRW